MIKTNLTLKQEPYRKTRQAIWDREIEEQIKKKKRINLWKLWNRTKQKKWSSGKGYRNKIEKDRLVKISEEANS